MMMIRNVFMMLVSIAAVYAAEQHTGTLLRGAGGNAPELLGAVELIGIEAGKSCKYEFKFGTDDCPSGNYCHIGNGMCLDTGVRNQRGVCKPMPMSCPANQFEMVCGCDGSTWTSPCEAAKFGFNVAHNGVCKKNV
jgi:hypothetical protein